MPLLTAADFPEIRAAIDIDLDAEDVPDAIIALDLYQGAGERAVLVLVPEADGLAGDELARARTAAILFTAALVTQGLPRITQERIGNYSYSRAWDTAGLAAKAAELRSRAHAALTGLLPVKVRRSASYFGIARAGR
jgi:pyrrolidone-carboxylate peptidase